MKFSRLVQAALFPLSMIYDVASRLDSRRKQGRAYRATLSVVSIGNITTGGTGKTPLVALIARHLQASRDVLVLSRGYGRTQRSTQVWRSGEPLPDPASFGDEPALLARLIERGGIAVGADRSQIVRSLEHSFPGAVVILDDGFQHRQLERQIDIVIVDDATARKPHRLLPVGRLRERPDALRRADIIVATSTAARVLAEMYLPSARVFSMSTVARRLESWVAGTPTTGTRAILVTGIAHPVRVSRSVAELGIEVIHHLEFDDHHQYSPVDCARILSTMAANPGTMLVTTDKDAVKLEGFGELKYVLNTVVVEVIVEDEERFLRTILGAVGVDTERMVNQRK